MSNLVKASNEYYLQTGQYPSSFDQLDIDFNLPTVKNNQCICGAATNWVESNIKKGDGFEVMIFTGGIGQKYRLGVFFTDGKYKCTGFAHILNAYKDTPSEYDGKTFCAESLYNRACGTNCDNGDFCKKIMGMDSKGYISTVFVYE